MPLRVAEKEGFVYALDDCEFCPFVEKNRNILISKPLLSCKHFSLNQSREVKLNSIPVWCPLPEPGRLAESRGLDIGWPNNQIKKGSK